MFEIYFVITAIISFNVYTQYKVHKDSTYFLDEEKPPIIAMIWYLPLIGAFIAQYRLHADKTFYITVIVIFALLRYGIYVLFYVLL